MSEKSDRKKLRAATAGFLKEFNTAKPQLPEKSIKVMEAMALKKYRVGVELAFLTEKNVVAHSKQEAAELVVKQGQGTMVGRVPPKGFNVQNVYVKEVGLGDKEEPSEEKAKGPKILLAPGSKE